MAVEFFAAVEEAQLNKETDLDNFGADFTHELGSSSSGAAGGEEVIEQQHLSRTVDLQSRRTEP